MTLPASGAIKFSDINKEIRYSASNQLNINFTGARLLPGKNVNTQVAMSNFYSTSNTFSAGLSDSTSFPIPASAGITFKTDGTIVVTGGGSSADANWFGPPGAAAVAGVGNLYTVTFTLYSGNDTWDSGLSNNTSYTIDSNRTVQWTVNGGAKFATLLISVGVPGKGLIKASEVTVSVDSML